MSNATFVELVVETMVVIGNELRADTGLTVTQYRFLTRAAKAADPTIASISEDMDMTRANGAVVAADLLRRGLVDAPRHPNNGRAKSVQITEAGRALMWRAEEVIRAAANRAMAAPGWER